MKFRKKRIFSGIFSWILWFRIRTSEKKETLFLGLEEQRMFDWGGTFKMFKLRLSVMDRPDFAQSIFIHAIVDQLFGAWEISFLDCDIFDRPVQYLFVYTFRRVPKWAIVLVFLSNRCLLHRIILILILIFQKFGIWFVFSIHDLGRCSPQFTKRFMIILESFIRFTPLEAFASSYPIISVTFFFNGLKMHNVGIGTWEWKIIGWRKSKSEGLPLRLHYN